MGQREALAHALAGKHILIGVDPRKSAVKGILVLPASPKLLWGDAEEAEIALFS